LEIALTLYFPFSATGLAVRSVGISRSGIPPTHVRAIHKKIGQHKEEKNSID
jgi:hypothetical protein